VTVHRIQSAAATTPAPYLLSIFGQLRGCSLRGGGRRKVTCDVSEKRGGNRYEKYQFASSAKFAEKFLGLVLFCVIHTGVGYSIWNLGKDMGVHVPIF
jgi:hypothetical protein